MKKFEFSSHPRAVPTFSGYNFYNIYKNAEFLRSSDNIETILSKGYELRQMLKAVAPGETIMVEGMKLEKNTPLLVKNTAGANVAVEDYEFTNNRLTGLVAAYAFENRLRFPVIKSSEAIALGLTWDNLNEEKCRLYLSAVTGTEHFYEQFNFVPLVCALRKLELGKITPELVAKAAKIKNNDGERLATDFKKNYMYVTHLWKQFPGSNPRTLATLMAGPERVKRAFEDV